jgi:hypothetical protein
MSAFDKLMAIRGLPLPDKDEVSITGSDPVLNTHFRLGDSSIGGDCWYWGCGQ